MSLKKPILTTVPSCWPISHLHQDGGACRSGSTRSPWPFILDAPRGTVQASRTDTPLNASVCATWQVRVLRAMANNQTARWRRDAASSHGVRTQRVDLRSGLSNVDSNKRPRNAMKNGQSGSDQGDPEVRNDTDDLPQRAARNIPKIAIQAFAQGRMLGKPGQNETRHS